MPEIAASTPVDYAVVGRQILARHQARLRENPPEHLAFPAFQGLVEEDPRMAIAIAERDEQQRTGLSAIASESHENRTSVTARRMAAYIVDPRVADAIEALAIERFLDAFNPNGTHELWGNLRYPSGAVANIDLYLRTMEPGAPVYAPGLKEGMGHLSHGGGSDDYRFDKLDETKDGRTVFMTLAEDHFGILPPAVTDAYASFTSVQEAHNAAWATRGENVNARWSAQGTDVFAAVTAYEQADADARKTNKALGTARERLNTALQTFFNELRGTDRAKYYAFWEHCVAKGNEEGGIAALKTLRMTGNPNVVHDLFDVRNYAADHDGVIDYDAIAETIKEAEPPFAMVILGFSANPRDVDYAPVVEAAHANGTLVFMDASHISALEIGRQMKNPFDYGVDAVMTTTHKGLRGEKGAGVAVNVSNLKQFAAAGNANARRLLDSLSDEDLKHERDLPTLASHASTFLLAQTPEFKEFTRCVVENARALGKAFKGLGWKVLGGDAETATDDHLILLNVRESGLPSVTTERNLGFGAEETTKYLSGKEIADMCEALGIFVNKNGVPDDTGTAVNPDGLRMGTVAFTIRGLNPDDMVKIAEMIDRNARKARPLPLQSNLYISKEDRAWVKSLAERHPYPFALGGLEDEQNLQREDPQLYALLQQGRTDLDLTEGAGRVHDVVTAIREGTVNVHGAGYFEGRPGAHFYSAAQFADDVEETLTDRVRGTLFGGDTDNRFKSEIQAPSTAIAHLVASFGMMKPGARILAPAGYEHTAGGAMGKIYNIQTYPGVVEKTGQLDIDALVRQIKKEKPALLVLPSNISPKAQAGLRAVYEAADRVGTVVLVDFSGDAGLVIAGALPNPLLEGADIAITDTSGSMEGPKTGALILYNAERLKGKTEGRRLVAGITRGTFPGTLGGPVMPVEAAQATALRIAATVEGKKSATDRQALAHALALELANKGWVATGGGSDRAFADVRIPRVSTGVISDHLHTVGLHTGESGNRDYKTVRIGTGALAQLGFTPDTIRDLVDLIDRGVEIGHRDNTEQDAVRTAVREMVDGRRAA